jgi:mycothiol synthase
VIRPIVAPDEFEAGLRAGLEAFRDHWGYVERPFEVRWAEFMHDVETNDDYDPTLWFVAMDGNHIAGTAWCDLKTTEEPTAGYIDVLAVRRDYRKRGIGLALLLHIFNELHRRGQRKARLTVDAGNLSGALRLYERAGMKVLRQIEIYEKELRPGRDLTVQG